MQDRTKRTPMGLQLKAGWREVALSDILSFSNGSASPMRSDESPIPVYGSNGVIGHSDETNSGGNVVVIGRVGSYCGSLHFSESPCWVTDNAIRASPVGETDARFTYYLLHTLNLNEWRTGSGQPLLNQAILSSIPAIVPPLSEQQSIARVLATLDDKIELNRRMNETLEAMARALFKSWFVDFEPVRAKMEGRWRPGESLPGLPAGLYDLFPDRLAPSELGEVPEGWEVKQMDDIANFLNGLALQRYPANDGPALPVIKIAQLRAGHTDAADFASAGLPDQYVVHDGDILFSWSGSLEIAIWTGGAGALNQHLFKVTSMDYPKWLLYLWLQFHLPEFRSIAAGKATTMGHIRRHHLGEALVIVPDIDLQDAMSRVMQPLFDKLVTQRLDARAMVRKRDALLPDLVSGEVQIQRCELAGGMRI